MRLQRKPPVDTPDDDDEPADISLPDSGSLVRHPDGYYWLTADGHQQFGPFDTPAEALLDMHAAGEESLEPGETLLEAEQELGLADWVDPDSGSLAEGTATRLEDH